MALKFNAALCPVHSAWFAGRAHRFRYRVMSGDSASWHSEKSGRNFFTVVSANTLPSPNACPQIARWKQYLIKKDLSFTSSKFILKLTPYTSAVTTIKKWVCMLGVHWCTCWRFCWVCWTLFDGNDSSWSYDKTHYIWLRGKSLKTWNKKV